MSEPTSTQPTESTARPFPWSCPKCRRKEVRRATIPYQCERLVGSRSITVVVENLCVPRCGHCGELVFDYEAEEQINRACEGQTGNLKTQAT